MSRLLEPRYLSYPVALDRILAVTTMPRVTAIIAVAMEEESRRIRENYRTPRKYIVGLSG